MLSYEDKIILAPMVRIGTLPMRLLALRYGADIVYSEELIDWKFLRSKRRYNGIVYAYLKRYTKLFSKDILNTVDYVDQTDGTIVFRTCAEERNKVVLQIGTCSPERALKVAKLVECDVAAIDINMGCPKEFSVKGGMGVALLEDTDKACCILKNLVDNISIPVSCKIRIFETPEKTYNIVKKLVNTGIKAIAIHGRTRNERPQHAVHTDIVHYVADRISIPVIANGGSREIEKFEDILKFKEITGCSSVMIARAAEWNCSIFRKEGLLPMDTVIKEYLKLAIDYDNSPSNTKYCIQNILRELQDTPRGRMFLDCQAMEQICAIWDLRKYCQEKQSEYQKKGIQGRWQVTPDELEPPNKKARMGEINLENVIQMKVYLLTVMSANCGHPKVRLFELMWKNLSKVREILKSNIHSHQQVCFIRANYNDINLPKAQLHAWAGKKGYPLPNYETHQIEKLFCSILTFNGKKYTSTFWEKNKKFAEQSAALVALFHLELLTEEDLIKFGGIIK